MEGFKLKRKKLPYTTNTDRTTIRVSVEAYNTLVDMANESTMAIGKIASKAIMYAYEHLEFEEEGEEE